uniref:Uncharacterized protein n=1 Tax=Siphoviridae sp. ctsoB6 TaxID=2826487 RepID=A0A8S5QNX3_9CAUD|nr:MAG TPA: hypothetical protein [Siphoviridae sp. ctsoB6]
MHTLLSVLFLNPCTALYILKQPIKSAIFQ